VFSIYLFFFGGKMSSFYCKLPTIIIVSFSTVLCLLTLVSCQHLPGYPSWGAPQISNPTPANGEVNVRLSVTLCWKAYSGSASPGSTETQPALTGYYIFFARVGDKYPKKPFFITTPEYTLLNLLENSSYKWYIVVLQSDGQRTIGPEWVFTTGDALYDKPEINLIYPEEALTVSRQSVRLTWEATPGNRLQEGSREVFIEGYDVIMHPTSDAPGDPIWVSGKYFDADNLEYAQTYVWQVTARQSDGQEATSTQRTFTTMDRQYDVPEIYLLRPTENLSELETTVTFTWVATPGTCTNNGKRDISINSYEVFLEVIGKAYGESRRVIYPTITIAGLDYGTTYRWKIKANQSDGQSVFSKERQFSTQKKKYEKPEIRLVYPENGTTGCATRVTLTWEATPGNQINHSSREAAISVYWLFFSESGAPFTDPAVVTEKKEHVLYGLVPNTEYKWKVAAFQNDGAVAETEEATFRTQDKKVLVYDNRGNLRDGYDRISEAVDRSNNNDMVVIVGGTVLTNETEEITIAGKELNICSSNQIPAVLEMAGKNARAFKITEGASVTLKNLVIQNSYTEEDGGAMFLRDSGTKVTTLYATMIGNTSEGSGGAVYIDTGAEYHAGFGTVISDNESREDGGGIYLSTNARLRMENTVVSGNRSGRHGGGAYIGPGNTEVILFSNRFENNNTGIGYRGGGLFIDAGSAILNADNTRWLAHRYPGTTVSPVEFERNTDPFTNNIYTGNSIHGDADTEGASVFFAQRMPEPDKDNIVAHACLNWVRVFCETFAEGTTGFLFTDAISGTPAASSSIVVNETIFRDKTGYPYLEIGYDITPEQDYWVSLQCSPTQYVISERTQTSSVNTPTVPEITFPANNAVDVHPDLSLKWASSEGAACYRVLIGSEQGHLLAATETDLTEYATNLLCDTMYYWQIESVDHYGATKTSSESLFTTGDRTGKPVKLYQEDGLTRIESYDTLTQAVDAISDNASYVIKVRSGATLFEPGHIVVDAKNLTIISTDQQKFQVDMAGKDDWAFLISNNASVTIENAIITNARVITGGSDGGAFYIINPGTKVVIRDCIITGNQTARRGGGVFLNSAKLTLIDSQIVGNFAGSSGGGVYVFNSASFCAENTVFSSNTAESNGGGIYSGSPSRINECTVSGNEAKLLGGGIYAAVGLFLLENSVVAGNLAGGSSETGGGGGMYLFNTSVNVTNSLFYDNSAIKYGGGIRCNNGTLTFVQSSLSGNGASLGGGIFTTGTTLTTGATISENVATTDGGGLYLSNGVLTVSGETVISSNSAGNSGGGIFCNSGTLQMDSGIVIANTAVTGRGGGLFRLQSRVLTGGIDWFNVSDRQNAFSVTSEGMVRNEGIYESTDPIRVNENTAAWTLTGQMAWNE
jgi:predicted outer membrane repeat protein